VARTLKCQSCDFGCREGSSEWDRSFLLGRCIQCGRFFEEAREQQARQLAREADTVQTLKSRKKWALAAAVCLCGGGLLGILVGITVFHHAVVPGLAGLISGAGCLQFAFRWTPDRFARHMLEHRISADDVRGCIIE
jgi:hypothetical protein